MYSSPISASRSPRIPSPPPSLPTLFPAISSLSPLAPLMNSASNNNAIFDLSQNNYSLNNNNNRTNPLPAPVFLDLQTEINRSVMTMPSLSSLSDFGGYNNAGNKYEALSNQKINTKTDLFAGSPLLQESLVDAPAVPSYFDKMSSFYSSVSSCGEILSSLAALFSQNNIDHKIKDQKKQIKGLAYVNEHPVHFRVYVYFQSVSKYLIEFQKRDGCCFAFRQLYKSLIGQMSHQLCNEQCVNDNSTNNNNASYSGSLSLAPLSLKESRAETFNQCSSLKFGNMPLSFLDHDSVNILLTMAQADCMQSQREALRALSSSSAHDGEQACHALMKDHQSEQLIKFFSAINAILMNVSEQDQELIRCALTFFNNLLEQKTSEASSIRSTLFSGTHMDTQRFLNKILSLLDDPIHLSDELTMAEIKRQCARFIATVSQFNANDIKPLLDVGAWSIINRYENCDDSRLRMHINAAKVALAK